VAEHCNLRPPTPPVAAFDEAEDCFQRERVPLLETDCGHHATPDAFLLAANLHALANGDAAEALAKTSSTGID
jgi:hypothetical protein